MPEARQWNLTFERVAFWNSRFRASYIGTMGKNLLQGKWSNVPVAPAAPGTAGGMGKDVVLTCSTPSLSEPVTLTVGWQWETIAPNGLARMIAQASADLQS